MKSNKPGSLSQREIADQALRNLLAFAAERGKKSEIAEQLTQMTGQEVKRQQVEKWLHSDPEKREIPNLGAGIALALVVEYLRGNIGAMERVAMVAFTIERPKTNRTKKTKTT